jgi:tyrosinase
LLLAFAAALVSNSLVVSDKSSEPALRVRKDVKDLTAQEKADFVNAILRLKQTPSPWNPKLSYYDQFVQWHNQSFHCNIDAAHMWASFLPWHREFLRLFEDALRQVSGKPITIPYWDWTDPNSTAAVFTSGFMGGPGDPNHGYAVMNGPFRKGVWKLNVVDPKANDWYRLRYLVRRFGTKLGKMLPTSADVAAGLSRPTYDVKPYDATSNPNLSFRNYVEGWRKVKGMKCEHGLMNPVPTPGAPHDMHNGVHLWVGGVWSFKLKHGPHQGTMALNTSLNDPVFWLHHANIDRLWEQWEAVHNYEYRPLRGQKRGQNLHDTMWPYRTVGINTTISDLLHIEPLGYTYATP